MKQLFIESPWFLPSFNEKSPGFRGFLAIGLKNFIRKLSNFYDLPSFLHCL